MSDRVLETSTSGIGTLALTSLPEAYRVKDAWFGIPGLPDCYGLHMNRKRPASRGMKFRFTDYRART